ncbi:MAG: hypothetical protein WBW14_12135 [Candidatus Acidiferrum sp.]
MMTAIKDGATRWHRFPIRSWAHRKVEIASMYDTEHYRPQYDHKIDLPIFLTRSK